MAEFAGYLYSKTIPAMALDGFASPHGFKVATGDARPAEQGGKNILMLSRAEVENAPTWLPGPYNAYIEVIDGEADFLPETLNSISIGTLAFSFATSTAYQIDSAALVCDALMARGVLSPLRRQDVELSLHETISNAVVHGNLNLESARKGGMDSFTSFALALKEKMNAPEARRRVEIRATWDSEFLDITVIDMGQGYDESKLPVNDPFAPAGRGLAIIRSLTLAMNVTNGGRMTTLRFLT